MHVWSHFLNLLSRSSRRICSSLILVDDSVMTVSYLDSEKHRHRFPTDFECPIVVILSTGSSRVPRTIRNRSFRAKIDDPEIKE